MKTVSSHHVFKRPGLAIFLTALMALSAVASSAPASGGAGRVTAFSHYGNGSATGAVRKTWFGYEVQTPKGSWLDCRGDCRDELRKWALDFWETRNEDAPNRGRQ